MHQASQDIVADFWDGYAFGHAVGIGIQSITKWYRWTATDIKLKTDYPVLLVHFGPLYWYTPTVALPSY